MAKKKDISLDDLVGSKDTRLVPPNNTLKEQTEVKTSNLKTIGKYALTVVVTLTVVVAGYAFYKWSYNQGVNDTKQITQVINAEVASQLKQSVK